MECRTCGEDKPHADFQTRSDTGRYRTECRTCRSAVNLTRYHTNASTKEASHKASWKNYLNKLYGLTPEQYDQMRVDCNHLCQICSQPETQKITLAVDHCHATGKVRGLLCMACNTAIGKLRDDPSLIRRAAEYVELHSSER